MGRLELAEPSETTDGQFWYVGRVPAGEFKGRDVRLNYIRSTRSWLVTICGFTGLPSRRVPLKTVGGVRGRLGSLFCVGAVHLTGWKR